MIAKFSVTFVTPCMNNTAYASHQSLALNLSLLFRRTCNNCSYLLLYKMAIKVDFAVELAKNCP